jgi:hypothetical protein
MAASAPKPIATQTDRTRVLQHRFARASEANAVPKQQSTTNAKDKVNTVRRSSTAGSAQVSRTHHGGQRRGTQRQTEDQEVLRWRPNDEGVGCRQNTKRTPRPRSGHFHIRRALKSQPEELLTRLVAPKARYRPVCQLLRRFLRLLVEWRYCILGSRTQPVSN